jgi:hypothetical protein
MREIGQYLLVACAFVAVADLFTLAVKGVAFLSDGNISFVPGVTDPDLLPRSAVGVAGATDPLPYLAAPVPATVASHCRAPKGRGGADDGVWRGGGEGLERRR